MAFWTLISSCFRTAVSSIEFLKLSVICNGKLYQQMPHSYVRKNSRKVPVPTTAYVILHKEFLSSFFFHLSIFLTGKNVLTNPLHMPPIHEQAGTGTVYDQI